MSWACCPNLCKYHRWVVPISRSLYYIAVILYHRFHSEVQGNTDRHIVFCMGALGLLGVLFPTCKIKRFIYCSNWIYYKLVTTFMKVNVENSVSGWSGRVRYSEAATPSRLSRRSGCNSSKSWQISTSSITRKLAQNSLR